MNKKKVFFPLLILAMLVVMGCSATSALTLPSLGLNGNRQPAQAPTPAAVLDLPAAAPSAALGVPSADPASVAALQGTLEQIYEQVNPSVVNVDVLINSAGSGQQDPFGNFGPQEGLGSGFVWDTEGHIVTNNHVVDGASQVQVTFADGRVAEAEVIGRDVNSDLAVLKVDVPQEDLIPVRVADSSQVKVGQLAIAIGNPYGLSGTMTSGIISALSRSLPVDLNNQQFSGARYSIPDIIQTDASINPGNSGGVLVDSQGQLIGVTSAIQSTSGANAGIGFVIPSNLVQKVVPVLITDGTYNHSYLGITGTTLSPSIAEQDGLSSDQQGVLVIEVAQNGPAEKAGLKGGDQQGLGGDVIVAIDGQPVIRFDDMVSYLYNQTEVGQVVTLTVLRDGSQQDIQVTLGQIP